jgi:hypothetical protein
MKKQDLTATSWVATRITVGLFVATGILFLFRPAWLGWDSLVEWCGGETRVLAAGVGAAFLLIASLAWEKDQLRVRTAELMEGMSQLLYGKDYARQREAIEILVATLDSKDAAVRKAAHENLVRITGQNFADDANVWRAWWESHKRTWAARKPGG